jgi:hypothetical protein
MKIWTFVQLCLGISLLLTIAAEIALAEPLPTATVHGYLYARFRNELGGYDPFEADLYRTGSTSLDVTRTIGDQTGQFVGVLNLVGGKVPKSDTACSATGTTLKWAESKSWIIYSFRIVQRDPEAPLMPVWVSLKASIEATVTNQAGYSHPTAGGTIQFRASPAHSWEYLGSAYAYSGRTTSGEHYSDSKIVPVGQTGNLYIYTWGSVLESNPTERGEWQVVADPIISIDPSYTVLVNGVEVPASQLYDIQMSPGFLPAYGDPFRWVNPAGGAFHEAANWETFDGPAVPGANADLEFVSLPAGRSFSVALDQGRTIAGISVCDADVTFDLNGHRLDNNGSIFIGQIGPERGLLRIQNGTLAAAGGVKLGMSPGVEGVLQIPAGATLETTRVRLDSYAEDTPGGGTLLLDGGTLRAEEVVVSGPRSKFQFNAGHLVLDGGYSYFSTGELYSIGNGTDAAMLTILSGGASFYDGLTLADNATLELRGGTLYTPAFSAAPGSAVVWTGGEWNCDTPLALGAGESLGTELELDDDMLLRANWGLHVSNSGKLVINRGGLFAERLTYEAGARLEYAGGGLVIGQGDINIGSQFTGPGGSTEVVLANAEDCIGTAMWGTPGIVMVDAGYTLRQAAGTIQTAGLAVYGTFDYGGPGQDDAGRGILELYFTAENPGSLRIGAGGGDAVINGRSVVKVAAPGHIYVIGGALQIDPGYELHLLERTDENVGVYADSIALAGTLRLERSSLMTNLLRIEPTGTLCGEGIVYGTVENDGIVSPGNSPGLLEICGDFTQTPDGKLVLEIAGPAQFDTLLVHGTAFLGGTLEILLRDGYVPQPGETFMLLEAQGLEGSFDAVVVSGGPLHCEFSPTGLVVQGVPEPSSILLLLSAAVVVLYRRQQRWAKLAGGKQ